MHPCVTAKLSGSWQAALCLEQTEVGFLKTVKQWFSYNDPKTGHYQMSSSQFQTVVTQIKSYHIWVPNLGTVGWPICQMWHWGIPFVWNYSKLHRQLNIWDIPLAMSSSHRWDLVNPCCVQYNLKIQLYKHLHAYLSHFLCVFLPIYVSDSYPSLNSQWVTAYHGCP